MHKPITDNQHIENLRSLVDNPGLKEGLSARKAAAGSSLLSDHQQDLLDKINDWLSELRLLYGVPFCYLAANSDLLPQDAIRFFYVDENWLNALVDGALSIGLQSEQHAALKRLFQEDMNYEARARTPLPRQRLRKIADEDSPPAGKVCVGFLLRSPVVSAFPGLEVTAFKDKVKDNNGDFKGENPIDICRMDRLAPDVMLCIFNGVPALVQINEPPEGLAFGTQESKFQLRGLGQEGNDGQVQWKAGEQITKDQQHLQVEVPYRDNSPGTRVVDLNALQQTLQNQLEENNARKADSHFGPADFALQLIRLPEQKKFYRE
ncbi:MAG: hypothetical protein PVH61_11910 [Candidatus Aminicenantes bacterium]|jgi:hypothetical protein